MFRSRRPTRFHVTGGNAGTLSDCAAKRDFADIDPALVLDKVARLPLSSWADKANPGMQHSGPTAQDFRAAFLRGDDDARPIATVAANGVALAAIQGVNAKVEERGERIAVLQSQLARQQGELAELRRAVELLVARGAPELLVVRR